MSDELQTVECLYVGRRVLTNGKIAEGYLPAEQAKRFTEHDFETHVSLFEAEKRSKARARGAAVPGGVYKMDVKLDERGKINTAKTGSREYVNRYQDSAVVVACETRDAAADMHVRSARLMAKLKAEPLIERELGRLRALYRRTPHPDKMALELIVLHALRRGL